MSIMELMSEAKFINGKFNIMKQFITVNPALELLGVSDMYLRENGEAVIVLPMEKKHTNGHGFMHGGIYATLLDTALGIACACANRVSCVTLGMATSFIAPCKPGAEYITVGRAVHIGRKIMMAEGEVLDHTGKIMAKGQGTFFVVDENRPETVK